MAARRLAYYFSKVSSTVILHGKLAEGWLLRNSIPCVWSFPAYVLSNSAENNFSNVSTLLCFVHRITTDSNFENFYVWVEFSCIFFEQLCWEQFLKRQHDAKSRIQNHSSAVVWESLSVSRVFLHVCWATPLRTISQTSAWCWISYTESLQSWLLILFL